MELNNTQKRPRAVLSKDSLTNLKLISKSEYRSVLRKHLPEEYFKPNIKHTSLYIISMMIYFSCMFSIMGLNFVPFKLALSIIMGITLGALTFFLHDLCHGSIIQSKRLTYFTGLSVGLLNLFAPLFWQRVHNLHHATTGHTEDPDRSYTIDEKPKSLTEKIAYKTRLSNESVNPIVSLILMSSGFFWYFFNTMYYGLVAKKTSIKEEKKYQRIQQLFKGKRERAIVTFELIVIFLFQAFLFTVVAKYSFVNYILISLLPVAISHFIAMLYIHTNHFLSPLTGDIDDPLVNSLSLKNSWFVDKIFSNFSHHVEHHLFPAMSSDYYPKVRKLLLEMYPDRFQLIPMKDAVKLLFKTPRIYGDYTHLVSPDGKTVANCLLPKI